MIAACPVCDVPHTTPRCRACDYDFENADPHPAIARLQRKARRARWTWVIGLLALVPGLPFLATVLPFGAAFIALLVVIFGTPMSMFAGISMEAGYQRQLRIAKRLLPQLPAARVVER